MAALSPAVGMVAPVREKCGVADYTRYLTDELRDLCDLRYVIDPSTFGPEVPPVDLVHIQHQYFLYGGVAPWKNRFGRFLKGLQWPAVMTVHEFVEPAGNPVKRAAIKMTNRLQFRNPRLKRLLVHTRADRAKLLEAGIDEERMTLVRHGVPQLPPLPPREEARRALGMDGRPFVITLFGFLSRRKGHALALQALRELHEPHGYHGHVRLLFAGGAHPDDRTTYAADIRTMARELGLHYHVEITGYLSPEKVAAVMSATDLVIAPFTDASGSGSLAMAFACGKPILASDIPPHREYLEETPGSVSLFPAGDSHALAQAIVKSEGDERLLQSLSDGARRYAEEHTYARMAQKTVEVYRAVLSERD
jgi:glycosyltransferase involved in cell wall biosynthesis